MHPLAKMGMSVMVAGLVTSSAIAGTADNEVDSRQPKLGLLNAGTNTIAQLAQDLFSRSTTSSQVLSLNLTNLVILMVIKALIFGAGHLGLGGGAHDPGLGRSVEQQPLLSQSELQLMLSYLQGDVTHHYGCLHYSACSDPKRAKQYLSTAKVLRNAADVFGMWSSGEKYSGVLTDLEEAVQFGMKGYDCSTRYSCHLNAQR